MPRISGAVQGKPPVRSEINRWIDLRSQIVHIGSEEKDHFDLHKPHAPEPYPAIEGTTGRLSTTFKVETATSAVDLLLACLEAVFEAPAPKAGKWAADHIHVLADLRKLRA